MSSPSVSVIVSDKRGVTDTETPGTHALTYLAGCRNINPAKPFNSISLASNPTDTQRRPNCQTPGGCWDFWLRPPSLHLAIPSTPQTGNTPLPPLADTRRRCQCLTAVIILTANVNWDNISVYSFTFNWHVYQCASLVYTMVGTTSTNTSTVNCKFLYLSNNLVTFPAKLSHIISKSFGEHLQRATWDLWP